MLSFQFFVFIVLITTLSTFNFVPSHGGAVDGKSINSKVFYIDNPYARDKFGKSLCGASESRKAILSPIDIDLQTIRKGQFKQDLKFTGLDLIPESITVHNTGFERMEMFQVNNI